MKKRKNNIHATTISKRLVFCFLGSTLIPTVLITALLCLRFDTTYRETAFDQMQISRSLIGDYVSSYFSEIDTITTAPYYHSYFLSRESFDPSDPDYLVKVNAFQEEMQNLVNLTTYSHSDISDLLIWSDGQYLYQSLYNELWYFSDKNTIENQSWYTHALEGNGKTVFTPTRQPAAAGTSPDEYIDTSSFYITKKITNLKQPEQINLVILNLTSRPFDSKLKEVQLLYDSFVVITNERNELIYSSKALTESAFQDILSGKEFFYDDSHWNCISANVEDFLLKIHVVYSLDDISEHTFSLILSAIGIYLLGLLLAFILFRYLNRWISHSADTLLATFAQLEDGNLEAHCPPVGVEEFNQIGNSVNDMIAKLNEKIKNEYLMTIHQKSIQLYALQSQIQPHFLINTIYCFIALNQIGEKDKLNSAFYSLAHLLRYVLNQEYFTTIGQEQDFLEDYLKLQQLRFGPRLSYRIDCPEEFRDLRIPRLLLQPLVENAIIHGIEPCEHPCLCRIRVFYEAPFLHILIEDNGVGFDPEELERKAAAAAKEAFQSDPEHDRVKGTSKTSIGLYYVKERLTMWSEQAVLSIRCEEVTRAEIQIPWEGNENESSDR